MQVKDLQLKRTLRCALIALMLGMAGLGNSYAERVEPETAQRVAATFFSNNGVRSDQLINLSERAGFSNLYIFNGEPGFVILAADDCVKPILGYSLTGRFAAENMPANLRWWLKGYDDEIQYAIDNQVRSSIEVSQEWEDLKSGEPNRTVMTTIVEPLIESTWGQGWQYNAMCPIDSLAGEEYYHYHCPTGCAATAMAQIMRYWKYPIHGTSSHSYYHSNYGWQTINFGAATYDWANMPLTYANPEIAKLMYHCGVSVDMNYGPEGSSTFDIRVFNAIKNYFGYSHEAYYSERDDVNDDDLWIDVLKYELDAGRPVYYGGDSIGSHAFVCDGYDSGDNFHFNWGWDGEDQNDYYSIDIMVPNSQFNFSKHQDAIFGIQPIVVIGDLKYIFEKPSLTATVVGHKDGTSATGSLIIPSSVSYTDSFGQTQTYEVVSIARQAFYNCSGLTGSLTIPNSVTSIGDNAFFGCSGLTTVYWNAVNVTSYPSSGAFSYCTNLATVIYGNMVQTIPDYALWDCNNLTTLTIGNSVTSIGFSAFPSSLTTLFWNPVNVTSYSFSNYTHLTTVVFGDMVQTIPNRFLYGCTGLTGDLVIPNSVTTIGEEAFYNCGFTGTLTIGNSVTTIGKDAFNYCRGFSGSLIIPNSVITIGESAFSGCRLFTGTLTIGNSVVTIGKDAFRYCRGFTGSLIIPNSVTTIGDGAFCECSGFTGFLVLSNSVTSIGQSAFANCIGFTGDLIIPNSVVTIGDASLWAGTFQNCIGFTGNLIIGNSVTTIGDWAFSGCSGLTGPLTIPNSVTSIEKYAFSDCSGLTGPLTIPNSVTSIEEYAFYKCSGLTGPLTIPNSVTSIEEYAFNKCSGLTGSLTIPNSVTSIGSRAFCSCSGLETIVVESDNPVYDSRGNCNAIIKTSINELVLGCKNTIIPNSVTSIGEDAFYNCNNLTSIEIPNSVTSIGNWAFGGCNGLISIYSYGVAPPTAGNAAFYGVDTSIPVYVPSCSATDYGQAAQWNDFTNYQDTLPCVPTFTGNGTDNLWSNPDNWSALPSNEYDIIINSNCEMDEDVETSSIIINNTGTLIVKSGHVLTISENPSKSGTLVGEIVNHGTAANLVIEDGGQLVYNQNGIQGTVQKGISYYTVGGSDGWHLVAYPLVGNGTVASQSNMLSNYFDLYDYDEPTHYWRNYKNASNNFTQLEAGTGYLYANSGAFVPLGTCVGNGTGTTAYSPFYTYYNYSISENLFRATELEAAGLSTSPLGSLCWYATNSTGYEQSGISIWMANVSDEELTETSHLTDGMTLVYTGSMTPIVGWNEFVFNENSFSWDGTSNVLVCIQRNNGAYNSSIYWQTHNPGFASKSQQYTDDAAYDMTSQTYSMTVSTNFRPNTIFKTFGEVGIVEQTPIQLSFAGELENGAAVINIPLNYTETAGNLKGFNLVGNPFVHNVTSYAATNVAEGCFRMNEAKDNFIVSEVSETMPLKPAEGFFVKATAEGASITFNVQTRSETNRDGFVNMELNKDGILIDRLIVRREGELLEKMSLKENSTRIFATNGNHEMAVVVFEGSEQPFSFKAAKNGTYTISVNVEGLDLDYLHLIDNLTGDNVDLLIQPAYTFEAKTTDYASRFKLVFSVSEDADCGDVPFAFINNGNIVVTDANADAVLQVVDMMGHIVVSTDVARNVSTHGMVKGVYVLRLIDGDVVRTQKIVID